MKYHTEHESDHKIATLERRRKGRGLESNAMGVTEAQIQEAG